MEIEKKLPFRKVWWLNPSYIVGTMLIPVYLLLWFAGSYTNGEISTAKGFYFFYGEIAFLGFIALFVMFIGTLSPIKHIPSPKRSLDNSYLALNMNVFTIIGCVAMIGYLYWFKDIILNPNLLISQLQQSTHGGAKALIERGAGVGSLAQLGLIFILFFLYQFLLNKNKLKQFHYFLLYIIIFFVVVRAFLWAERLAMVEVMVAAVFVWVSYSKLRSFFLEKTLLFFPLLGVVFIVLFFSLGEFFRSWSSFYVNQSIGFWEFIFQRLVNYYFEALNTGSGLLMTQEWPTYEFNYILSWLHKMPFIGGLFSFMADSTPNLTSLFLEKYADPEFNSPSGIFSVFSDIGIILGLLFFFFIGVISRYFYSMLEDRVSFYGLFYFIFLMVFLELFRYLYVGESRVFMIGLGFLVLVISQKRVLFMENSPKL